MAGVASGRRPGGAGRPGGRFRHEVLAVVLQVRAGRLQVLLWQRAQPPFPGCWALPGGPLGADERLGTSLGRHLAAKVDVTEIAHLEQLETRSDPRRDPREREVATAYLALVSTEADPRVPADTAWHPVDALPPTGFDHASIVESARERLRSKLSYTNIGFALAPAVFTIAELRAVYAASHGHARGRRRASVGCTGSQRPRAALARRWPKGYCSASLAVGRRPTARIRRSGSLRSAPPYGRRWCGGQGVLADGVGPSRHPPRTQAGPVGPAAGRDPGGPGRTRRPGDRPAGFAAGLRASAAALPGGARDRPSRLRGHRDAEGGNELVAQPHRQPPRRLRRRLLGPCSAPPPLPEGAALPGLHRRRQGSIPRARRRVCGVVPPSRREAGRRVDPELRPVPLDGHAPPGAGTPSEAARPRARPRRAVPLRAPRDVRRVRGTPSLHDGRCLLPRVVRRPARGVGSAVPSRA